HFWQPSDASPQSPHCTLSANMPSRASENTAVSAASPNLIGLNGSNDRICRLPVRSSAPSASNWLNGPVLKAVSRALRTTSLDSKSSRSSGRTQFEPPDTIRLNSHPRWRKSHQKSLSCRFMCWVKSVVGSEGGGLVVPTILNCPASLGEGQ